MRPISKTPIEQRVLFIQGIASPKSLDFVRAGLPANPRSPDTEYLFLSYAFADIPLGTGFSRLFPWGRPGEAVSCTCRLVASTQQCSQPFDEIPHGWKTVCLFHFPQGIPQLVRNLPVVDGWDADIKLGLCTEEVLRVLAGKGN